MKNEKRRSLDEFSDESERFERRLEQLASGELDEPQRARLVDEIAKWLRECGKQGRYIPLGSAERRAFRSLLEGWNSRLRDHGYYFDGIDSLADFDPSAGIALTVNCPYPGLEPYTERLCGSFFGREELVASCVEHLERQGHRILMIVGASGSGKSSLALAGVLPRLLQLHGRKWFFGPRLTPGAHPLSALARAVAEATEHADKTSEIERAFAAKPDEASAQVAAMCHEKPLMLFIDQFEELLTMCSDAGEQGVFAQVLCALSEPTNFLERFSCRILLTLRTDHLARFEKIDALKHLHMRLVGEDNERHLSAIGFEEIRRAIKEPADKVGVRFIPPTLIDQLASETTGLSNGLPLLQFALVRLWETRPRNEAGEPLDMITADMVKALPDVERALGTVADSIFRTLSSSQQRVCERLFLELLVLDETFEEPLRRRRNEAELRNVLMAQCPVLSEIADVVDKFVAAGLLRRFGALPDCQLEVAHEALLRHWNHLYELITGAEVKERLHLIKMVGREAAEWEVNGRSDDYLDLRGERLARATAYGADGWLGEAAATEYVKACTAREEEEKQRERRTNEEKERADRAELRALHARRNMWRLAAVLLLALALTAVALFFAQQQSRIAAQRKELAEANQRAADAAEREADAAKRAADAAEREADAAKKATESAIRYTASSLWSGLSGWDPVPNSAYVNNLWKVATSPADVRVEFVNQIQPGNVARQMGFRPASIVRAIGLLWPAQALSIVSDKIRKDFTQGRHGEDEWMDSLRACAIAALGNRLSDDAWESSREYYEKYLLKNVALSRPDELWSASRVLACLGQELPPEARDKALQRILSRLATVAPTTQGLELMSVASAAAVVAWKRHPDFQQGDIEIFNRIIDAVIPSLGKEPAFRAVPLSRSLVSLLAALPAKNQVPALRQLLATASESAELASDARILLILAQSFELFAQSSGLPQTQYLNEFLTMASGADNKEELIGVGRLIAPLAQGAASDSNWAIQEQLLRMAGGSTAQPKAIANLFEALDEAVNSISSDEQTSPNDVVGLRIGLLARLIALRVGGAPESEPDRLNKLLNAVGEVGRLGNDGQPILEEAAQQFARESLARALLAMAPGCEAADRTRTMETAKLALANTGSAEEAAAWASVIEKLTAKENDEETVKEIIEILKYPTSALRAREPNAEQPRDATTILVGALETSVGFKLEEPLRTAKLREYLDKAKAKFPDLDLQAVPVKPNGDSASSVREN